MLSHGRMREGPGAVVSWRWLAGILHSDRMRRHSARVCGGEERGPINKMTP